MPRLDNLDDVRGAVLCAGLGTRLRPATAATPKPGVPFMGRPISMHSVAALSRAGVRDFGCNLHYLPGRMRQALGAIEDAGFELTTTHEEDVILGTGGGVRELWKELGTHRTLVVCHGDVVLGTELGEIIAAHRASDAPVTLVLKLRDGTTSLRGVFTDATGRISRILDAERPGLVPPLSEHAFTGIQILEPEVFERFPSTGNFNLVKDTYASMLEEGVPIAGHLTTAFYADLGTYERYLLAQKAVFDKPERLPGLDWPDEVAPGIYVDRRASVEAGAVLEGPVRIEGECVVRAGARLGPYVTCSGALEIAPGAVIENAAVWGDGRVEGEIKDTLLPCLD